MTQASAANPYPQQNQRQQHPQQQRCEPTQHDYITNWSLAYRRDEEGRAVRGNNRETQENAVFQTLFCKKCGDTREIQVIPRTTTQYSEESIRQAETQLTRAKSAKAGSSR